MLYKYFTSNVIHVKRDASLLLIIIAFAVEGRKAQNKVQVALLISNIHQQALQNVREKHNICY